MTIGTRSVLFGAHQFAIHPWFVAAAWWKLYGFPWDPRLWVAFFVHDLGYLGKPNMDGEEGEQHPELGARIMHTLFDRTHPEPMTNWEGETRTVLRRSLRWHDFTRYHSRFLAKRDGLPTSRLCMADKLAIALTPGWLYVPLARLSGEIREYRSRGTRRELSQGWDESKNLRGSDFEWWREVQAWVRAYVAEHHDGRPDTWTKAGSAS